VYRKLVAAAALIGALGVSVPAAHAVGPIGVTIGSKPADITFSEGNSSFTDRSIESHLIGLIDRERAAIITNIYQSQPGGPVDLALQRAKARGVAVWITNGQSENALGWAASGTPERRYRLCDPGGCIQQNSAVNAKAHSKFMLFYDTRRSSSEPLSSHRFSVWVASANLNGGSGTLASNNAITYWDDSTFWWQMWSVWMDMFNGPYGSSPSGPYGLTSDYYKPERGINEGHSGLILAADSSTWVQVSPDQNATTDMLGEQLASVQGPNVTPSTTDTCRIEVAMAQISDARLDNPSNRTPVRQLARLRGQGCAVKMVVGFNDSGGPDIGPRSQCVLRNAGIPVRKRARLHDKTVTLWGSFDGVSQGRVWPGSHNWTGNALLHNDELLLTVVSNGPYYANFRDHADRMYGQGTGVTLTC
jgi:hypothetical protein